MNGQARMLLYVIFLFPFFAYCFLEYLSKNITKVLSKEFTLGGYRMLVFKNWSLRNKFNYSFWILVLLTIIIKLF
jgi:hypothetical protein